MLACWPEVSTQLLCPDGRCSSDVVPNICIPQSCGELRCGTIPDGCGGTLVCGADCSSCVPQTDCKPDQCGTVQDGCGGDLNCGDCDNSNNNSNSNVNTNNNTCTPKRFCDAATDCGVVSNNCGGTLNCPACPDNCTPKTTCDPNECGTVSNNCGGTLSCGPCAFEFNDVGDYARTQTEIIVQGANLGVEAWVYVSSLSAMNCADQLCFIVAKAADDSLSSYTVPWYLGLDITPGQPRFVFRATYDEKSYTVEAMNDTVVQEGQWYHLFGRFDGRDPYPATLSGIALFVNGNPSTFYSISGGGSVRNGSGPVGIGANPSVVTARGFRGRIDEVRIWSRFVTMTEINQFYNNGQGKLLSAPDAGLSAGYHLDLSTNNASPDFSSNGFNFVTSGIQLSRGKL